ncbi:hypothetical protein H0E87_004416 [Populus deltoides]|uniref:Uncharacterized protein n=1 Tax=Populus deltoides TaxID=3696 RepID=A0A8T2ZF91_POPDE|nr:hypothetical protein H0E87_004416 [Populus deltoides]
MLFVFSFISIGWFLAWKLVLVHVSLVQEIFGPRKDPTKPKPLTLRISRIYDTIDPRYFTPAGIGGNAGLTALDQQQIEPHEIKFQMIIDLSGLCLYIRLPIP